MAAKYAVMWVNRAAIPVELTDRQWDILRMLACEGLRNKEVAYRMGLSSKTVDTHRLWLLKKLGIPGATNARLVGFLFEVGALESDGFRQ